MSDVKTSIRVGDGPEIPINLDNPEDPANAEAKEALGKAVGAAINKGAAEKATADQLRLFIERIENLQSEAKGIAEDIKDVFSEAKSQGYDTKAMKVIIRVRKMETHIRQEQAAIVQTYANAVGLQWDLPL